MWGRKQLYLPNKHIELKSAALNRNPAVTSQATRDTGKASTCSWLGVTGEQECGSHGSQCFDQLPYQACGHKPLEDSILSAATSSLAMEHSDKDPIAF